MINATGHDRHVRADYERLRAVGIAAARDAVRWHLIETRPYHYDFASFLPMVQAARETGVQVIWDLFHYGWPTDLEIFQPEFVNRFRAFAKAFAHVFANETDSIPFISPINEISYFAWAAGDAGYLNPFAVSRSFELKAQLVRATIEAIEVIWDVLPNARIVHADPVINVIPNPQRPEDRHHAEGFRLAQYQAWDMLSGRLWPLLGGQAKYLDIIGLNYYNHNQWVYEGEFLDPDHPLYRPFSDILGEIYTRYKRPILFRRRGSKANCGPSGCATFPGKWALRWKLGYSWKGFVFIQFVIIPGGMMIVAARLGCGVMPMRTANGHCINRWPSSCSVNSSFSGPLTTPATTVWSAPIRKGCTKKRIYNQRSAFSPIARIPLGWASTCSFWRHSCWRATACSLPAPTVKKVPATWNAPRGWAVSSSLCQLTTLELP